MAESKLNIRIQNKYDTADNWKTVNPVLKTGEIGFDDLGRAKVGDGVTSWNSLNYINDVEKLVAQTDTTTNEFNIAPTGDKRIYYFKVTKDTTLDFISINDELFFVEKRIYIHNIGSNEITLTLNNAEWANDAYNTDWGKPGMHLYLQATWIGGRIIVEVVDNDQLADEML